MSARVGELRMLAEQFAALKAALLADAPLETVAICHAGWWIDGAGNLKLLMRDWRLATESDYLRRGGAGAVVTAEFLAPSIKRARISNESVILAHTHPFSSVPGFSGIDDGGEDVLIPKIRERADSAPHGGFVVGTLGGSARAWPTGAAAPLPLVPRYVGALSRERRGAVEFARQELALGPGTSAALGDANVAVVGVGGLGWTVASALATHGIGALTLVDHDTMEQHNRSRLPGSRPDQVGMPKVEALASYLKTTAPTTQVHSINKPVADVHARAEIALADVVVTATDNLASRLDVDRLARRLLVPLVDVGIDVELRDGAVRRVGGRVNVSWPQGPCLTCMGVLSPDRVAAEVDPLGYRGRSRTEEAAVMSFNMALAGLAVTEVLDLLLRFRKAPRVSRYLAYDGLRGLVREIAVPPAASCGTCGDLAGAVFGSLP